MLRSEKEFKMIDIGLFLRKAFWIHFAAERLLSLAVRFSAREAWKAASSRGSDG